MFVNTRRMAERLAHHLAERIGRRKRRCASWKLVAQVAACGREEIERRRRCECWWRLLRWNWELTSARWIWSCQIGSPRSIAVALQRMGRRDTGAGRFPKDDSLPRRATNLMECAALVRAMRQGDLDRLVIPEAPLDILAQQIVAACAAEEWDEDEMFALVRRAYPYRKLTRETFDAILEMLSEGIAARRGRYGAYVHRDRVNGELRARRGARLAAITSGGAIPDNSLYTVVAEPEGVVVGTVDEDFAVESTARRHHAAGEYFVDDSSRRENGRVLVEDAHGAPPTCRSGAAKLRRGRRNFGSKSATLREEDQRRVAAGLRRSDVSAKSAGSRGRCRVAESRSAGWTIPARSRRLSTSLQGALCWARCRRRQPSSPSDFLMKAAECSW